MFKEENPASVISLEQNKITEHFNTGLYSDIHRPISSNLVWW